MSKPQDDLTNKKIKDNKEIKKPKNHVAIEIAPNDLILIDKDI